MSLNPNLEDFWTSPAVYRVLYGGRMSSKTYTAAGVAILLSDCFCIRVACLRQYQNKIRESVHSALRQNIEAQDLGHRFKVTDKNITNLVTGSEFIFYGISKNLQDIKGLNDIDITWIEEAEALTFDQWHILKPTLIRKQGSEIWIIFNPKFQHDFVYQNFVVTPPAKSVVRKINYDENIFLSEQAKEEIKDAQIRNPEIFQNVYLGVPKIDNDDVIIRRSWLESCVDAHIKLGLSIDGAKNIGFDVGDKKDECAIIASHGSLIYWAKQWRGTEDMMLKSCSIAYFEAERLESSIVYDVCGIGLSAGAKFSELNQQLNKNIKYTAFNAGSTAFNPTSYNSVDPTSKKINKDVFANVKAQQWVILASRAMKTYEVINLGKSYPSDELLFFDSKMPFLEQLLVELSSPKQDSDLIGRIKVESKDDMKARGIKSPNLADACIMATANIRSVSWWDLNG